jgi:hypothetical protein
MEDTAAHMSTDRAYEACKKMWWYQQMLRDYAKKKYGPNHWWAIILTERGKPNIIKCVKCDKVYENEDDLKENCNGR